MKKNGVCCTDHKGNPLYRNEVDVDGLAVRIVDTLLENKVFARDALVRQVRAIINVEQDSMAMSPVNIRKRQHMSYQRQDVAIKFYRRVIKLLDPDNFIKYSEEAKAIMDVVNKEFEEYYEN